MARKHCTENMKTRNLIPVLHMTVRINFICKMKRLGSQYSGSFSAPTVHESILGETQDSFFFLSSQVLQVIQMISQISQLY